MNQLSATLLFLSVTTLAYNVLGLDELSTILLFLSRTFLVYYIFFPNKKYDFTSNLKYNWIELKTLHILLSIKSIKFLKVLHKW